MVEAAGGIAIDLGIAVDRMDALDKAIQRAIEEKADVLVTLGGASVGDYDLVQTALVGAGMDLGFWRIAMRPGKPLMHGRLGGMRVLGLPGNPEFVHGLRHSVICAPFCALCTANPVPALIRLSQPASLSTFLATALARTTCAPPSATMQKESSSPLPQNCRIPRW